MTKRLALLILTFVTGLLYLNSVDVPWYFDDSGMIVRNRVLNDVTQIGRIFAYNPPRFLGFFSFAANIAVGGFDVFGFHVVNLLVHIAMAVSIFVLLIRLFELSGNDDAKETIWLALIGALLFAVHPLHTQAVVYIWQRVASMSAMFYIAGLAAFMRQRYAWAILFSFGSMFTKQTAVTLPIAMLIADVIFRPEVSWKNRLRIWLPQLAPVIVLAAVVRIWGTQEWNHLGTIESVRRLTSLQYLVSQSWVLPRYLELFLWPSGLALEHHIYPTLTVRNANWLFVLGAAVATTVAWRARRRYPLISFGYFFYFIAHAVESSVIPLEDLMFEHRTYLPDVGLCMIVVGLAHACMHWLANRQLFTRATRSMSGVVAAIILITLSYRTYDRIEDWRNPIRFYSKLVNQYPALTRPRHTLAGLYIVKGDFAEAERQFKAVISHAVSGHMVATFNEYGRLLARRGDRAGAIRQYHAAILEKGTNAAPEPYINLALVYFDTDPQYAKRILIQALNESPDSGLAMMHLAELVAKDQGVDAAIKLLEEFLQEQPFDPYVGEALVAHRMQRDGGKVDEVLLDQVIAAAGDTQAVALRLKVDVLIKRNDLEGAQKLLERIALIAPRDPSGWQALAQFWLNAGNREAAVEYNDRAQELCEHPAANKDTCAAVRAVHEKLRAGRQP